MNRFLNFNKILWKVLALYTNNIVKLLFISSIVITQDWELVWSDEFEENGEVNSENWFHQTQIPQLGSWYNGEIQHYTDRIDNSFVSNGTLKIIAKNETYTDQGYTKQYTSARLNSKYAFKYGKVEIRAKLPEGNGTWPALWMLGKNIDEPGAYWQTLGYGNTPWPDCGEVDIMEHWGSNQNYIQSAIHTPSSFGGTVNLGGQYISNVSSEFHIYTFEWYEEEMIFSVDDNIHYIYSPETYNLDTWPFDSEMYLLLNIAILPSISPNFNESSMEIDYIRIYENQNSCIDIICDNNQICENGNCVDIPIAPKVTFLVDMQNEDIDETGVYVSGSDVQLAGPTGLLMSDIGNNIWELTIDILPGTYTYKFKNGFYDYWDSPGWEPDLPEDCGFGEWSDRQFIFSDTDLVLGPFIFGSCILSEFDITLGDINNDGTVNILDAVLVVSIILDGSSENNFQADLNSDWNIDILDVILLIEIIIN